MKFKLFKKLIVVSMLLTSFNAFAKREYEVETEKIEEDITHSKRKNKDIIESRENKKGNNEKSNNKETKESESKKIEEDITHSKRKNKDIIESRENKKSNNEKSNNKKTKESEPEKTEEDITHSKRKNKDIIESRENKKSNNKKSNNKEIKESKSDKVKEDVDITEGAYIFKPKKEFNRKDYEKISKDWNLKGCIQLDKGKDAGEINILCYEEKKTKELAIIQILDKIEDLAKFSNLIYLRDLTNSRFGINHMVEHYVDRATFGHKQYKVEGVPGFNAVTTEMGLQFVLSADQCRPENLMKIINVFKDKDAIKKAGKKYKNEVYGITKIDGKKFEKGRIFFEEKLNLEKLDFYPKNLEKTLKKTWEKLGCSLRDVRNYKLKNVDKAYKKLRHPSSALTYISTLNDPEVVLKYLDTLKEWCDCFKYKKSDKKQEIFDYLKESSYSNEFKIYHAGGKKSNTFEFNDEKIEYKNVADLIFYCPITERIKSKSWNVKDRNLFCIRRDSIMRVLGREEIEELGYKGVFINVDDLGDEFILSFFGDDTEKLAKKNLVESAKKIMSRFIKKINSGYVSPSKIYYLLSSDSKKEKEKKILKNAYEDIRLYREEPLPDLLFKNYLLFNNPFPDFIFDIDKDGKVKDSIENFRKNINDRKNDLSKLEILERSVNEKNLIRYITYEKMDCNSEDMLKKRNKCDEENNIRAYFKNFGDDRLLFNFLNYVFREDFLAYKLRMSGYVYSGFVFGALSPDSPYYAHEVKESREIMKKYFKDEIESEGKFSDDIKNYKLSEEDYNSLINSYLLNMKRSYAELEGLDKKYEKFKELKKSEIDAISEEEELINLVQNIYIKCARIGSLGLFKNNKSLKYEIKRFKKFNKIFEDNWKIFSDKKRSAKEKEESMQKVKDGIKDIKEDVDKLYEKCKNDIKEIVKNIEEKDERYSLENVEKAIRKIRLNKIEEGKEKDNVSMPIGFR